MRLTVATLADFAEVREGLLFVSGAGIDQVFVATVPIPLPLTLALLVQIEPRDGSPLELKISVDVRKQGQRPLTQINGLVKGSLRDPSRNGQVSLAIDLRMATIPDEGRYRVDAVIGAKRFSFPFDVQVRMPPFQLNEPDVEG
ncbi:MAG TPA: hypothetical protein VKR24_03375 [Candidatus Limnocylindrales bacterium]|nr:hypothetical protein [Candidatus Limnocylindrales bacterium]